MRYINHFPKGVLSFLALFVLISCFIGSIPVAAADGDIYEFDEFWFGPSSADYSSNFSDFSYTLYSMPHFFSSSDPTIWFGVIFEFSDPVPLSTFSGKNVYCRTSRIPLGAPVVSQSLTFYDSNGNRLSNLGVDRRYSYTNSVISYTFTFGATSSNVSVSKAVLSLQPTSGYMGDLAVYTFSTDVPYSPGSPDPEPPTPATGEWQAFTQFIFGIFGTMGSIINNLLAAGGLSSIFFGFVFGIPIANFIIFLIEEIFDLEPYDPSSSWRREEHSLKELRPADYNNFPGDPPSNRIGF